MAVECRKAVKIYDAEEDMAGDAEST